MNNYKVIWFDDEFNELPLIKEKAMLNGITLIGYSNAKAGIDELERNIRSYDAALIDGLFFANAEQSGIPSGDKALFDVAMALERLASVKKLPWFILSGQMSFTKEKNRYADGLKDNKVYDKLNDTHLENLWKDIKIEADKQIETQIRLKYQRVFEVCTPKYIGTNANNDLLEILKSENLENAFSDPKLYFNPLRKIMDDLFIACNKYGFIPDVFVKPSVALNESSKFLSGGAEKAYQLVSPFFPKVVSDNVRSILSVCQPAAHRAEIDNFIAEVNTPYLLLSITYQLLDVLLWFKHYVDNNDNIEENKTKYRQVDNVHESAVITCLIAQDANRNYHCDDIILTYKHVTDNGYKVGDKIRIIKIANNTNEKTMHLYSKSALTTEKI
jgi:hypothetical protein